MQKNWYIFGKTEKKWYVFQKFIISLFYKLYVFATKVFIPYCQHIMPKNAEKMQKKYIKVIVLSRVRLELGVALN